ncbi:MAG TPA: aromatic amino acid lyase, partial [Holophaga sp.]|nr:aromatic amino acid lyase [Holophaga sp.]
MQTISIDGFSLTPELVLRVARPEQPVQVVLAPAARRALQETCAFIERTWMHDEAPLMYGFNTGVGLLKDTRVKVEHIDLFQTQLIKAHAAGLGEPFPEDVCRAVMLLRANAL